MKAFNKTRRRLLEGGRLQRYLLYAFGEIVLVVAGILIALQLNAWKAGQHDREQETVQLKNLKDDLALQLEIIDAQMIHDTTMSRRADSAFTFFTHELPLVEFDRILYGSGQLGYRKTFVASDASFKELLSTGGLALITDRNLRTAIMRYYQQLDYTKLAVNTNNGLIDQLFNLNASNSAPCFSMDVHGNLDPSQQLSGQDRYRLHKSITARRNLSQIALEICDRQRTATLALIAQLDKALQP